MTIYLENGTNIRVSSIDSENVDVNKLKEEQ